ncbi:hypothetical protein ACQP3L_31010, partial [Escherichia coli]
QVAPRTTDIISTALGVFWGGVFEGLLLKTSHTLAAGHREINHKLNKELPIHQLAFTVLEI